MENEMRNDMMSDMRNDMRMELLPSCPEGCPSDQRQELQRKIKEQTFALIETGLFLDTHPHNAEAMDFYQKTHAALMELEAEWETCCGKKITRRDGVSHWSYVDLPWPWQKEE